MSPFDRVWKRMTQMYGPHWPERWGVQNEAWAEALRELTYSQITAGLKAVQNSGVKYFELDLPAFLKLCRPVVASEAPLARVDTPPPWQSGMPKAEIRFHQFACIRFFRFLLSSDNQLDQAQLDACVHSLHRVAHEFYEMAQELGETSVPDSDHALALDRQWERDLRHKVSA